MSEEIAIELCPSSGVGEFPEPLGHGLWVKGRAVIFDEYGAAVDTCLGPRRALLPLTRPMAEQGSDRCGVQVDDAVLSAGGLDRADVRPVSELDDLLTDSEAGPV